MIKILRKLLVTVIVIGALMMAAAAPASAATLLNDDFEDGNSTGWSTSGGSWSVVTDGTKVYKQSSTSATAHAYNGTSSWSNYSVQARVKALSFNGSDRYLGLCARFQSSSNYYYLVLTNTGKLEIRKKVSGAATAIASKTYTVTTGTWYVLKLVLNGSSIQAYVNGALELSATDSALATGKVGFTAQNAGAEFDDLLVESDSMTPTPTPSATTPTPTPSAATPTPTPSTTTPTPVPTSASTYYVAANGNDSNPGTLAQPFLTIAKAVTLVTAGDTIYVRGGSYGQPPLTLSSSGVSGRMIKIWAYPGETPDLDFSNTQNKRAIMINGSHWHLKGLIVKNSPQHGITIDRGTYNIVEQCTAHHNGNMGINITDGAAYNTILNCDSHSNYDVESHGENADGFGAKYATGPGNLFKGCRAWNNADDGYDLWDCGEGIRFEDCWAYKNGVNLINDATFKGDGNGFKLGGGAGRHVLNRCVSWGNLLANGFEDNKNTSGVEYYNCTGYNNKGKNFEAAGTGPHIAKNNLSYLGGAADDIGAQVTQSNNSWNGFNVSGTDFLSLDDTVAVGARAADGGLPVSNFLKLASGSSLINAGVDVGLPYLGSAPDLGAYEKQ